MTSQEPKTPHFADRDIPDTEVIVVPSPAPVFVDSTGRRRRVLRRLAYAFGGLCMVYGGLVSVSLAGGPVSSSAVLPLPDLRGDDDAADAKPTPIPAPSTSAPPQSRFITEALRRPVSAVRQERTGGRPAAATPSRTPTPRPATKSPTPKPTPRPVESTTTDPVEEPPKSEPPSTGPSTPAAAPTAAAAAAPTAAAAGVAAAAAAGVAAVAVATAVAAAPTAGRWRRPARFPPPKGMPPGAEHDPPRPAAAR